MSKSKNKSKKPQQNEISEEKELDVKVSEETEENEAPAEENIDDKAEKILKRL